MKERMSLMNPVEMHDIKSSKRVKVNPRFDSQQREGVGGEHIEAILKDAEKYGFLAISKKKNRVDIERPILSLKNTYTELCRKLGRIYVEVLIDKEQGRAYATFDAITMPWKEDFEFDVDDFILKTELASYYDRMEENKKRKLSLPAELNPYRNNSHKISYFLFPKQITFSFFVDQPEIFFYILRRYVLN